MENRTPEEELEYRRYLRKRIRMRKRRRQVMLARAGVGLVGLLLVFLVFYGIWKLSGPVGGTDDKKAEATKEPEVTPLVVDIPEGYEKIYQELFAMREGNPEIDDILINLSRYPEDLLTLLTKDIDTLSFVSDYLMHVDDEKPSGEIAAEELNGSIPLFQQWDKRWGYVKYGNNIIAINGCGPTCMSMVYTGLTAKIDKSPAAIAAFCIENSYYTEDSGTSWALMSDGAKQLGLNVEQITLSADEIRERLETGQPVICSMGPGDFTETGHFIVLYDVTRDGKVRVNDPNSITRSQTEWELGTVIKQSKAAWAYAYATDE